MKPGGKFFVLHSLSRERINFIHRKIGEPVKDDLIPKDIKMIDLFRKAGFIEVKVSNNRNFYMARGVKPDFFVRKVNTLAAPSVVRCPLTVMTTLSSGPSFLMLAAYLRAAMSLSFR